MKKTVITDSSSMAAHEDGLPSREQALELLLTYNRASFHISHAHTVECAMRWFAERLGYGDEADFWALVGLLHDLDFELYPQEHCVKQQELMRGAGLSERLIRACASHGYQLTVDIAPEHEMEKVLYAVDELTGLIGAVALMRPSRSVQDIEVKSVRKKYKNARFAAGCSRPVIERGAKMLGWDLDYLIEQTILALRACEATCDNCCETTRDT
ncbi:MAG: hydrolase [Coriobacteriales bacterium]|nr:hydrolase [Coriobacteriales bacterium]